MSAIRTNFFSSMPSGAVTAVASASGTRRYSAWPPSRPGEPKSCDLEQREENPWMQ